MKYRSEIDGLRAVAVLPVLFFHAGSEWFSGGYVGVDVFFVISGYLITTLLLADMQAQRFSLAHFYERRARRILPALLTVSLVTVPLVLWLQHPQQINAFAESLVATGTFVSNVYFWRESGYFGAAAEYMPLLHTWSLAVEEQFYLVFPLILLLIWRWGLQRVGVTIAVVGIASFLLSVWASHFEPYANFFLTPTRVWELMAGAIVAWYLQGRAPFRNDLMALLGLCAILYSIVTFDQHTLFPGIAALLPVGGTALIILFAGERTYTARGLSFKPLVWIGLISYSTYLWHQPLMVMARHLTTTVLTTSTMWFVILLSLGLAALTWKYIEQPARRYNKGTRRQVLQLAVLSCLILVLVGATLLAFKGHIRAHWLAQQSPGQRAIFLALENEQQERSDYFNTVEGIARMGDCRYLQAQLDKAMAADLQRCAKEHGRGVLILGDSHAIDLFGMMIARFDAPFLVAVAQVRCRPHDINSACHYDEVVNFIRRHPQVFSHVIYEQAGFYLLLDKEGEKGHRKMFRDIPLHQSVPDFAIDREHVKATLMYLTQLSQHIPVTWLGPRIEPHIMRSLLIEKGCNADFSLRPNQQEIFRKLDAYLAGRLQTDKKRDVNYVSQLDLMAFNAEVDLLNCKDVYWSDGDHLSSAGEERFSRRFPDNFLQPNVVNKD